MGKKFEEVIISEYESGLPNKIIEIFEGGAYPQPAAQSIIDAAYEIIRISERRNPIEIDEAIQIVERFVNAKENEELLSAWTTIKSRLDSEIKEIEKES